MYLIKNDCLGIEFGLGRFIGLKDANTRYLGLDAMIRLAKIDVRRSYVEVMLSVSRIIDYHARVLPPSRCISRQCWIP